MEWPDGDGAGVLEKARGCGSVLGRGHAADDLSTVLGISQRFCPPVVFQCESNVVSVRGIVTSLLKSQVREDLSIPWYDVTRECVVMRLL